MASDEVSNSNGGLGEPKWTGLANLTFSPTDNLQIRYGLNYIGKQNTLRTFEDNETLPDDQLPEGNGQFTRLQDGQTVFWKTDLEATIYHSLSAQYEAGGGWTLRGGVNNLFDEHPPFSSSASVYGNSPLVSQYDLRGRRFFFNVSKKFN